MLRNASGPLQIVEQKDVEERLSISDPAVRLWLEKALRRLCGMMGGEEDRDTRPPGQPALDAWLTTAARSYIPELVSFVPDIRRDYAAVTAALASALSQRQVEGQVNRLRMLKWQSFGRAGFELLRRGVLYRSP